MLRDYARLGLLLAYDGKWRGRQIIPDAWVMDATTVRADQPHLHPGTATPFFGYGYQTWILPGERRMFLVLGRAGPANLSSIHRSKLVMVNTAVHWTPVDPVPLREMGALYQALVRELGG